MATNYILKPFRFNLADLNFMRDQINFRPLFDADGNAIIAWNGTGTIYDAKGELLYSSGDAVLTQTQIDNNLATYGHSYASVTAAQGLRDPSGMNNNLYLVNATWGAVDQPFLQRTQVVYDQYVKPLDASDPNAFYALKFATSPNPTAADYTKRGDNLSTPDVNEATAVLNVEDYTPRMISQLTTTAGVTFQTEAGSTHLAKDANGFTQVADYGLLESLGQQDAQHSVNADGTANNEFFIGAQNPGVSPVNGWFVLFGQFFDHGLDFVGKGGDGTKITINLAPDDPLYGVIDPTTGQPATKIVISRADVSGYTADGTPQWVNHTSPYIDQSQTYGSHQEVTDLLREWVSTDGGTTYHAGAHMLDGNTSVAWENAFGETTHATLPTLNELRAHLIATGRADLSWEDVANLRNRDDNGNIITGTSGQALILDSNPRFDAAHFNNSLNPDSAAFTTNIATLSAAAAALGMGYTFSYNGSTIELSNPDGLFGPGSPTTATGASALALWVNFSDFSIKTTMQAGPDIIAIEAAVHDAVGDLLLASVGDHYIAGDGRVNENIGLTAVHHVWHEEHNFQVRNIQEAVTAEDLRQERLDQYSTYNHELLHEWQINTGTLDAATGNYLNTDGSIAWDDAKLFHAAKITVEMEYQHTAVDQFARTITPNIAEFVGYNSGEQADVSLDFSQVAYRFGHSTLRESIDLIDPAGDITGAVMRVALERAFLSPELFAQKGAAAIALGMTHQQANEIDEFVTPALNQGLLGMPLDLAAINIARGRDLGIPTLNEFRAAIGLTEYTSWADFGANMIHPDNLVNFIAAYSFDGNVARAEAIIGLENGSITETIPNPDYQAMILDPSYEAMIANPIPQEMILDPAYLAMIPNPVQQEMVEDPNNPGTFIPDPNYQVMIANPTPQEMIPDPTYQATIPNPEQQTLVANPVPLDYVANPAALGYTYAQALNFLNNTFNSTADAGAFGVDGFQHIDTWLGGLAEVHVTGGLLGETFDTVFADQISRLMNGDRFYYLYRLDQLQMGEGIINEQFKDIVERNTGVEHLNGSVFAYADKYYDLSENEDANAKTEHKYADVLADNPTLGIYSTKGNATTGNGDIVSVNGVQYIRDLRVEDSAATSGTTAINGGLNLDGTPNSGGESHEVIVATERNDLIYAWGGDDTVYGEGGNDIIYGGNGIDRLYGGDGNDRIYGGDGGDLLDGGAGDDYVSGEQTAVAAAGIDQAIGGEGNDILHSGIGIDKLSGESGDDFIFGEGDTDAFTHGGDGNDIIDGGTGGDLLWGDGGDDLIIGGDDQDISAGLDGDDILRPGAFSQAMGGGPDEVLGGDGKSDRGNDGKGIGFDMIDFSDHAYSPQGVTIDFSTQQNPAAAIDLTTPFPAWVGIEGAIASRSNDTILGDANANWLIGGSGNDKMTGGIGNDVIIGDGIRLDTLIGTYAGGYGNYIDGASYRADGFIQNNGLLDAAGPGFDKHFTEMLKSATFENLELGGSEVIRLWRNGVAGSDLADSVTVGDGGTAGTDTAVFTGNRADYLVERVFFTTANQGIVTAYLVTDTINGRDGKDIIAGVENLQFADGSVSAGSLFNIRPDGTLAFTAVENPDGVADAGNAVRFSFASSLTDGDNVTTSNPTGAVSTGITYAWSTTNDTPISNLTSDNPYVDAAGRLVTHTTSGTIIREKATYTDAGGNLETIVKDWNLVVGSSGNNTSGTALNGSANSDAVFGLNGNDTLNALAGDDRLYGGAGTDVLNAGDGNDYLEGGAGGDVLNGGTGDDIYLSDSGDTINEANNAGTDTVLSNTTYSLGNNLENLTLLGAGNINGTGNGSANVITGNSGNNTLNGGTDADTLIGGAGNDTYVVDNVADQVVENGNAGTDTVQSSQTYTLGTNVENLTLTGSNAINGTGNTLNNNIIGNGGKNTLDGGAGNDALNGGSGDDILLGGVGNDALTGSNGADTAVFAGAVAEFQFGQSALTVGNVTQGTDTLNSIENLQFTDGTFRVVSGTGSANTVNGSNASDILFGLAGNDLLVGGQGRDVLVGGADSDRFDFNATGESGTTELTRDLIADFLSGTDKMDFSTIDANSGINNNQAFSFNASAGAAFSGAGQLIFHYETIGNQEFTVIEGNVNADLGADFQVALVGHINLQAADIVA